MQTFDAWKLLHATECEFSNLDQPLERLTPYLECDIVENPSFNFGMVMIQLLSLAQSVETLKMCFVNCNLRKWVFSRKIYQEKDATMSAIFAQWFMEVVGF